MRDAPPRLPAGTGALSHGLAVLRTLAEAEAPLSASELAGRLDLSVATVSRILGALAEEGYIRRPSYRSVALDLGVLALAGNLRRHIPRLDAVRGAVLALARQADGLVAHLAVLHQDQLIYLTKAGPDGDEGDLAVGGYPLHLSSPGLLLLARRPRRAALAALAASRRRHGWPRPLPGVPADAGACLAAADELIAAQSADRSLLILRDWQGPGRISGAIAIANPHGWDLALALSGPSAPTARIAALLRTGHPPIEAAIGGEEPA